MTDWPYVLLSCAMSIDGYIDDATGRRLVLSNQADLDRVDEVRASCDAILVGAQTVRRDDPGLQVRSAARRSDRTARGLAASPIRVTLTSRGELDPAARFFAAEPARAPAPAGEPPAGEPPAAASPVGSRGRGSSRIVFAGSSAFRRTSERLGAVAEVVDAGDPVDLSFVLAHLRGRGVRRLMVEGGSAVHTQFLTAGLADELRLAVAPLFVGDSLAPRFVTDGHFPWRPGHRARLAGARQLGDVVVLTYALSDRFGTA